MPNSGNRHRVEAAMKRFRPFVSALLGLTLLVQGFAVSAAPVAPASATSALAQMTTQDMPCHGHKAALASHHCPCKGHCQCPDVCAGNLALSQSTLELQDFLLDRFDAVRSLSSAVTTPPALPLRPPIFSAA